ENRAHIWELPTVPLPVPNWVLDLAEAVSDSRLDDQGVSQPMPFTDLQAFKKQAQASTSSDFSTRLAKWLFADPANRNVSPFSAVTAETLRKQLAAVEQEAEMRIAKLNYTKQWMAAFIKFAEQQQRQFPTTFGQAAAYLPNETK